MIVLNFEKLPTEREWAEHTTKIAKAQILDKS